MMMAMGNGEYDEEEHDEANDVAADDDGAGL